jgi:anti-anti-sigma regulatory factor
MNSAAPRSLTDTGMHALVCDLSGVQPSAATIDALARLAVALRRQGTRLRLRHASAELVELIEFMGLSEVLRVEPGR